MNEKFIAYTDGACSNNQGTGGQPGGWGVIFLDGRKFSGGDLSTTNNRMELTAAIMALKHTPKGSVVEIHSDSAYLINAFEQNWIPNWLKRGWKTSQGKPVENQDLWKSLIELEKERNVQWIKVKGHAGDKWNELADQLAVAAIEGNKGKSSARNEERVNLVLRKEQFDSLMNTIKPLIKQDRNLKEIYEELLKQV